MMKSKLATAIALVGLMQSSVVYALGLGEIQVSSALNERLAAEIPLVNASDLDASQVLVSLASEADFARAGVDRDYFLSSVEFIVERGESGAPVLRLQTPDVVLEPYLNFLVELRWPKGRLLREYTVLLDLPNYSAAPARAINPVTVPDTPPVKPSNRTTTKPAPRSFTPASIPSANNSRANKTSAAAQTRVTVRADETLWGIAKRVKPNGTSINQTMLALQDLNPNAFINNNINLLKKGAVLRLPEGAAVNRINEQKAQQLIAEQQLNWQAADVSAMRDARESTQTAIQESAAAEGHLQLATIDNSAAPAALTNDSAVSSSDAANGSVSAAEDQSSLVEVNRLRNELAISLENLDRAAVENTAMDTRLVAMESQLADLEQLVSLKDQELASMRAAIDARRAVLDKTAIDDQASKTNASPPVAVAGPLDVIANALSISVEWVIGFGVAFFAAVMAILMWFFARRDDVYEATVFERVEPLAEDESDSNAILGDAGRDEYEVSGEQSLLSEADLDDESDANLNSHHDDNITDSVTAAEDYDAERDVIAEADIYLAYGRYEQAKEMLDGAIEQEPVRTDLQLKRLELFVAQQAPDLFRTACQSLLSLDPAINVAIEALLDDVENVSDWWPEGNVATPTDEFLADFSEDSNEDLNENFDDDTPDPDSEAAALGELEEDKSEFGLQLAYDADTEIEISEGEVGADNQDSPDSHDRNDEVGTKLDLARAYIDMGDVEGAREILDEVMAEGSDEQRDQANAMIGKIA